MLKKTKSIPIHSLSDENDIGIMVGKMSAQDISLEQTNYAHRHDFHFFIVQVEGTISFEVDFKKFDTEQSSVFYIHPNQVHRIVQSNEIVIYGLLIDNENLNSEYLHLLEEIVPVKPLVLQPQKMTVILDTLKLCINSFKRKPDRLYQSLLKDNSNALVALILSHYLETAKPTDKLSRFEIVYRDFKGLLEQNFTTKKRPSEYARTMHISPSYLYECVRKTTGLSVSHHIQERIILEAKRLLYHSNRSVKEIATQLGYDDYPYFSRLFTKNTGMSALTFRNKNLD